MIACINLLGGWHIKEAADHEYLRSWKNCNCLAADIVCQAGLIKCGKPGSAPHSTNQKSCHTYSHASSFTQQTSSMFDQSQTF